MIISQTPYRVSFAGGGTDLPAFYRRETGAVLSVAIARHMYVTLHGRFEQNTRVAYSKVELAERVADIEHELVREAMQKTGLEGPLEVTTIGDVPSGTGLGSSSTLTVGLLNAMYGYRGQIASKWQLGHEACEIEIDILKKPIGKQDQYAAAFGGMNYIRFNPDETVDVEPVPCPRALLEDLERRTLLLYTNNTRNAERILQKQSEGTVDRMGVLRQMRDLAEAMRGDIQSRNIERFAQRLHEGWELKRSLGFGISGQNIDEWYREARKAGAQGGKLLGAGGGGFMLLMAPPERHEAIRSALGHPRELAFRIDRLGSRIIFVSENC